MAETRIAGQNPIIGANVNMKYAPSMKNDPWEKLITPIRPRMMFRPRATRT